MEGAVLTTASGGSLVGVVSSANHRRALEEAGVRPVRALLLALALGAIGLIACGEEETAREDPVAAKREYCAHEREIDRVFAREIRALGKKPTHKETEEAAIVASKEVEDRVDQALEAAPESIKHDVELLAEGVHKAAEGDIEPLFSEETEKASARVDRFCFGRRGQQ